AKLLQDFFTGKRKIFAFHDKNSGIKRILTPKTSEKKKKGRTNGTKRGTAHPYHIGQIHARGKSQRPGQTSQHAGKSSQNTGQIIKTWEINAKYKLKMEKNKFHSKKPLPTKKKENKHNQQLFPK
ncbi:MAG: hypothetical protein IIT40_04570, partial [Prevotella sp.]|nr:hypothetical protein [Prevotella sp.]